MKISKLENFQRYYIPEPNSGCWLWIGGYFTKRSLSYGAFCMWKVAIRAHRASWLLHRGPIPDGLFVLHKCDVTECVNPDHLFLGTVKDNALDMCRKGRHKYRPFPPKLTEEAAQAIAQSREHRGVLAERYGVSLGCIKDIRAGTTWKHLPRIHGAERGRLPEPTMPVA